MEKSKQKEVIMLTPIIKYALKSEVAITRSYAPLITQCFKRITSVRNFAAMKSLWKMQVTAKPVGSHIALSQIDILHCQ